jgi:hypothetical protein
MNAITTENSQQQLQKRNYDVWFDKKDLTYGSIIDAMGEAVDDYSDVLLCMNEGYWKNDYRLKGMRH